MGRQHFQETGTNSFWGEYLYEQVVPPEHFLRRLDAVIDWEAFGERLIALYAGGGEMGRPPYHPVMLLKMLLLAYLYNVSERQVEVYVQENLPARWFVGLAANERAPDHTTLSAFKARIVERGQEACLEALLGEIVRQAQARGVVLGSIQIVDSTHSVAAVNVVKEKQRQAAGEEPRDQDARWGVKGRRPVRCEDGTVVERTESFYGYKMHTSMNAEAELITSVVVTAGNAPDGKQLARLVARDRALGLPVETYAADRGYDDTENPYRLMSQGLCSAIRLKRYRTEKKDANKEVWQALRATPQYQAGQAVRYKIERKYGEAKEYHGLRRCRSVGLLRYAIQAFLTAIVLNLKRLVRLLTGVSFRGRAAVAA
ncbi:MAG: IS5 family transposase [Anaerolineae bacterium]